MRSGLAPRLSLQTSIISDDAGFSQLASEWDELLNDSDQRIYFLRYGWNQLWWRTFRPSASQLFIITVRDTGGQLTGLAPLYVRERRTAGIPHIRELMFIGMGVYAQTSEGLDLIARRGYERPVAETVAALLKQSTDWDRLCLTDIPASSTVLPHLTAALGDTEVTTTGRAAYIMANDWERVLADMHRSTRKNLLYETRRLFKLHDCRFRCVAKPEELEPAMDALIHLHQARWNARGEPGSFAIPGVTEFLREIARMNLCDDHLRLWTLEVDGQAAAALIGFYDNGTVHYFQAGFDPALSRLSVGRVMLGLCIRDSIDDAGVREFDFMGGDNAYKQNWTPDYRESVTLTCMRSGVRALTYAGLHRVTELSKSFLRATLPTAVRLAGHRLLLRRQVFRQ